MRENNFDKKLSKEEILYLNNNEGTHDSDDDGSFDNHIHDPNDLIVQRYSSKNDKNEKSDDIKEKDKKVFKFESNRSLNEINSNLFNVKKRISEVEIRDEMKQEMLYTSEGLLNTGENTNKNITTTMDRLVNPNTASLNMINNNYERHEIDYNRRDSRKVNFGKETTFKPGEKESFEGRITSKRRSVAYKGNNSINQSSINKAMTKKKSTTKDYKNKKEELNAEKKRKALKQKEIQTEIIIKFVFYLVSNVFNVLTVAVYIAQTYETGVDASTQLTIIEVTFSFYFLVEYFIFMYGVRNKIGYIFSWDSLIDFITIVPSIISYFILEIGISLTFFRIFRMFRVFRILRIYKTLRVIQAESSQDNTPVFKINPMKFQVVNLVFLLFILVFIGSGIVLGLQDLFPDSFNVKNLTFVDGLYYMVVTATTMGFGDIHPNNAIARLFIIISIFFFFFMISEQISKMMNLLNLLGNGIKSYEDSGHIILVLDNSIQLGYFLDELRSKDSEYVDDSVVILTKDFDCLPSTEHPFKRCFVMKVGQIDFEVLDQANIMEAKAVFLFSNKTLQNCMVKDKVTELVLLQINQFRINSEKIYLQTLYFDFNHDSKKVSKLSGLRRKNTIVRDMAEMKSGNIKNIFFKKMIPIWQIKSKIMAKSAILPGFATFIQNLLFNNYINSPAVIDEFPIVVRNYLYGCENKIHIRPVPSCFFGKTFMFMVKNIYLRSINEYFTKLALNTSNDCKPVIAFAVLINGVDGMTYLEFYPHKMVLAPDISIAFIATNEGKHLDKIMDELETLNLSEPFIENKAIDSNIGNNNVERMGGNFERLGSVKDIRTNNAKIYNESVANKDDEYLKNMFTIDTNYGIKYNNPNTKDNLDIIREADENYNNVNLNKIFDKVSRKYFNEEPNISNLNYEYKNIKKRTFDLEKGYKFKHMKNHLLILGFQDNLGNLLKYLSYNFHRKKICIIANDKESEKITKLMKQYKNLYFMKGDLINPYNLINSGIREAYSCFFVCDHIDNSNGEDLSNILSFRAQDYFFNTKSIIELWSMESIHHLGYIPIPDKNNTTTDNEFVNPLFMAGNVIYLSHFEKIVAASFKDTDRIETWLTLINCGYDILENNQESEIDNPLIISVDVPEDYFNKEYITLFKDVLELDSIILGIYIPSPTDYNFIKNEGKIEVHEDKTLKKVSTSYKKSMRRKNVNTGEEFDPQNYYQIVKENSYNNKAIMDFIDVNSLPSPMFITNPSPALMLLPGSIIMVLFPNENFLRHRGNMSQSSFIEDEMDKGKDEILNKKRIFTAMLEQIQKRYDDSVEKSLERIDIENKRRAKNIKKEISKSLASNVSIRSFN